MSCGATPVPDAGTPADASVFVPTETRALGLNDVTFLLPLESLDAGQPFPSVSPGLISPAVLERVTALTPKVLAPAARLRVIAVRFDACDRALPGPCPLDADAVLRLVAQPLINSTPVIADDVTLHAFFPIPRAELPALVDSLRGLAALQALPRESPLQVSAAFTTVPAFRERLGALVTRYASSERLTRLTLFGQLAELSALGWVFRGEELQPSGSLGPISIPSVAMEQQFVNLFSGDSYQVTPVADAPAGFERALIDNVFRGASPAEQLTSVRGLLAIDNPTLHTSNTVQCVSCHVTTTLLEPRAADAGIDANALAERYTAPFDLTPLPSPVRFRTLRALGYLGSAPLISQRVVNESANVVLELEARFPPP